MTDKDSPSKDDELVTFTPAVSFLGFPRGRKGVEFAAGVESIPVPAKFAALMREKGLVADKPTKADAGEKSKA